MAEVSSRLVVNPARLKLDGDRLGALIDALERAVTRPERSSISASVSSRPASVRRRGDPAPSSGRLPGPALRRRVPRPASRPRCRRCRGSATTTPARSRSSTGTTGCRRRTLVLRVYGYYGEDTLEAGYEAFDDRLEQIAERDKYPEFDVPDFDGAGRRRGVRDRAVAGRHGRALPADLGVAAHRRRRATPPPRWRWSSSATSTRSWSPSSPSRPTYLGDLEAVSWTPPCETRPPRWTLDVWYLLAFDGRIGSGRSFLVDLETKQIVSVRDFSVRTG